MAAKKAAEEATTEETKAAPTPGTITVDGKEFAIADLSDETKAQIQSLRYVEAEMQRLQAQAAVLNTAKQAYANNLKNMLTANEE